MNRKTALVVAPGRGTYNKDELGYLARHHRAQSTLLQQFDEERLRHGQEAISELDGAENYSVSKFTRGDNASGLIYACAFADFLQIDEDAIDIVAITGNSMGWYIALACAGALTPQNGFRVVNTMGRLMHEALIGGQMLYPFVDEDWFEIPGKRNELLSLIDKIPGLYLSIDLGGMIVFGGDADSLKAAEDALPPVGGRFPMRLANHAAFHTSMQEPIVAQAMAALPLSLFSQPCQPLIDGRGQVWYPQSTDVAELRDYTLGHQVTAPYDFTAAVRTGIREFAPDLVVVLGPGTTLGGAVAQVLTASAWRGLTSKSDFVERQNSDPIVVAMGIESQRAGVVDS